MVCAVIRPLPRPLATPPYQGGEFVDDAARQSSPPILGGVAEGGGGKR
jgi:hypothetical protein